MTIVAKRWNTEVENVNKSLCGNCVAFDISPRMLECMREVSDESGHLGYCWMHHFKCHLQLSHMGKRWAYKRR